jgi:hypothetical protein
MYFFLEFVSIEVVVSNLKQYEVVMCKVTVSLFMYGDVLCLIVNKQQRIHILKCLVMFIIIKGINFNE